MDNHNYNLIKAINKRADAVWMYEQYMEDSGDCEECKKLWESLEREDERILERMKKVLDSHVKRMEVKRSNIGVHKEHSFRYH